MALFLLLLQMRNNEKRNTVVYLQYFFFGTFSFFISQYMQLLDYLERTST